MQYKTDAPELIQREKLMGVDIYYPAVCGLF